METGFCTEERFLLHLRLSTPIMPNATENSLKIKFNIAQHGAAKKTCQECRAAKKSVSLAAFDRRVSGLWVISAIGILRPLLSALDARGKA